MGQEVIIFIIIAACVVYGTWKAYGIINGNLGELALPVKFVLSFLLGSLLGGIFIVMGVLKFLFHMITSR